MNFCVGNIKHIKTTENKLDLECMLRKRWALFCISPQSPPRNVSILTAISKPCPSFTAVCEETSTVTPIFFQLFAKNSLIKNIFEEEKSLIVRHDFFFLKIVPFWCIWVKARTSSFPSTRQSKTI